MALSFGFRAILAPELAQIVRPAASFNFLKPPTFEDDWTTDPLEPPPAFRTESTYLQSVKNCLKT